MDQQTNSATFVWEISNYKSKTLYENSTNDFTRFITIGNHSFFLIIYYVHKGDSSNNETAISLRNMSSTNVNVMFRIALINEAGDECFVGENATCFIFKNCPFATKGGLNLLNCDCILDKANRLLPGGKLTIKCELKLLTEDNIESLNSKVSFTDKSIPIVQKKALDNYQSLLESGKYSDVVFVVDKTEYKLHKNILAAQSIVFAAMFDCGLEDSKSNRFEILDIQVEVFQVLIRYIYTTNFDSVELYALELFGLADNYQLDSLKDICAQSLGSNLSIDSVVNILRLADMYNLTELKLKCLDFIRKNCKRVTETKEWKEMMKSQKNFELIKELYQDIIENSQ